MTSWGQSMQQLQARKEIMKLGQQTAFGLLHSLKSVVTSNQKKNLV